jgi:transposase
MEKGDPSGLADQLLGLEGFRITKAEVTETELILTIETRAVGPVKCSRCEMPARAQGRYEVHYRDLPAFGVPTRLIWRRRRWHCVNPECAKRTWSEESEEMSSGTTLTKRAGMEITRQVGKNARSVEELAREFGVSWDVAMNAVREFGAPMVAAPNRVGRVKGLGVDETSFLKATPDQGTQYATGMVDLGRNRLIDLVAGNTAKDLRAWCEVQAPGWLGEITTVATDLAESYRKGLSPYLDHAVRVADPFHVVRVANRTLDKVRRRVQQEQLGHRGRKRDPLYRIRKLLLGGFERISDQAEQRILLGLRAGDPDGEVTAAWLAKESVRDIYASEDAEEAALLLDKTIAACAQDLVPEIRSLGSTLRSWRTEILAHHLTGISNGPTEGLNLLVKKIKRVGHGFHLFVNYRLRVLLHTGGVTWPQRPTPPLVVHPSTRF